MGLTLAEMEALGRSRLTDRQLVWYQAKAELYKNVLAVVLFARG
jgi:hypothetical protein